VALWRLPRLDFHRLVDTDFQDTPLTLRPARSPSRHATLYTESSDSFVASTAASIATGRSEPVPELHPLKSSAFHGANETGSATKETKLHEGLAQDSYQRKPCLCSSSTLLSKFKVRERR
jgi:hypothetical protein